MNAPESLEKTVASLNLVLVGLLFGVSGFTALAVAVGPVGDGAADVAEMLRYGVLGITAMVIIQCFVLYGTLGRKILDAPDAAARLAAYRSRTIVMVASAEGPALFAAVVALLTGFSWHVAPAFGLLAVMLALIWPTVPRAKAAMGMPETKADKYT